MIAIPAYCPNCKSIFPSGYNVSGKNVTLWGNKTSCPVCRERDAYVSEGVFDITNDAIEIISAPALTRRMLEALQHIAKQAAAGEISKEQAARRAREVAPEYGSLFERALNLGLPAAMLLVAILSVYLQIKSGQSSEEQAKKLLEAISQQTLTLKDIHNEQRIQRESGTPAEAKSTKKPVSANAPAKPKKKVTPTRQRRK